MTEGQRSKKTNDYRYPVPIFVFLTGLLGWVVLAAVAGAATQSALALAGVPALLALHLVLHWYGPLQARRTRRWLPYALAQAGLATLLTLVTGNQSVWVASFAWLIGETAGLLSQPRPVAFTLAGYGAAATAALFAVSSTPVALSWLGALAPTAVFVCVVVVLYKQQVEARERAQRLVGELERANGQIAAYADRVAELTLANERQRLARELHDTLSQNVAGLVLQLEAAKAQLDAGRPTRSREIIAQALVRARSTLREARDAIDDLRAREGGHTLSARLETLCARWSSEAELHCELSVDLGVWDAALPAQAQEQLERIVLEALANVRRHAQATRASVTVSIEQQRLRLRIADDGIGFQPRQVPPAGHYGLAGLHERARLLGGALHIDSAAGAGTTIAVDLPLEHVAAAEPAARSDQ